MLRFLGLGGAREKVSHVTRFARECETDRSARSGSFDFVIKLENSPYSKCGRATAATSTDEFLRSIQAPSSMHPEISYPVKANFSL